MEKVTCPSCRSQAEWKNNPFRPFCSKACKDRDLGKWANEEYRVPVTTVEGTDEALNPEPELKDRLAKERKS